MPKVSVLMPAYNQARFIGQAIDSVRAQSFDNWELIVVDDGSTDDTAEVVKAIRDDRVRYAYQPNRGCPSALNKAFSLSGGQQILILAADDWLLSNSLQSLDGALRQNPEVDVAVSNGYVADSEGNLLESFSNYHHSPFEDNIDFMVVASPVMGVHSAMMRRLPLEQLQGPFDEQMLGYEDWDLFIRLKASGSRFLYIDEPTCCYRFHSGNKSAPKSKMAERRRQALIHNRTKVLNAPWFGDLSLPARVQFFQGLLTGPLSGDVAGQERVLTHRGFQAMPKRERARLLYLLAVENSLGSFRWGQEFDHLAEAIRLDPMNPRPFLLLALSAFGPGPRRLALRLWRKIRFRPTEVDAVTQILSAERVA